MWGAVTGRQPIWIAFSANCLIAAATYAMHGWNSLGTQAAARNTARFSMLWFLIGFASPGLARLVRLVRALPCQARLLQAFLPAHIVHFAAVAALLSTFGAAHIRQHPGQATAVIVIGVTLAAVVGLMANPRPARWYTVLHSISMYAVFLIFFLAFMTNREKPLRGLAVLAAAALVFRVTGEWRAYRARLMLGKRRNL